ncbi:hypothetical protein ACFSTH_01560 [Paenibacillus yanchengensis]|uniref:Tissue inhibitor of metalloproteinase n=1 Tax=Paenibacillus yanchengensis TaxID=2035833 RepID=A0ABW4YQP0_9BACL
MKKNMVSVLLLCIVLIGTLFYAPQVSALSCAEFTKIEEAYDRYEAIIVGTVKKVDRKKTYNSVTIDIERSFKSLTERQIQVREDIKWGSVKIGPSQVGESYLYFLNDQGGYWENSVCSHSQKLADVSSSELQYLDEKEIPLFSLPNEEFQLEVSSTGETITWTVATIMVILLLLVIILWRWKSKRK